MMLSWLWIRGPFLVGVIAGLLIAAIVWMIAEGR